MVTNMKTVPFTEELRASPNYPDGLTKGWVFNSDNWAMRIRRQQSSSVVMIWGRIIENKLIGPFRVPEELKLSADSYCSFLKNLIEA